MGDMITSFILESGFASMGIKSIIMILIACVFLYLAIKKGYEPYLLIPISVGMLLANMPGADLMKPPIDGELGGLFYYLYQGVKLGVFPPLIFLCNPYPPKICVLAHKPLFILGITTLSTRLSVKPNDLSFRIIFFLPFYISFTSIIINVF